MLPPPLASVSVAVALAPALAQALPLAVPGGLQFLPTSLPGARPVNVKAIPRKE